MTGQVIFLFGVVASVLVMFLGMMWGDYEDGENTLLFKRRKSGVNSGAKFG